MAEVSLALLSIQFLWYDKIDFMDNRGGSDVADSFDDM